MRYFGEPRHIREAQGRIRDALSKDQFGSLGHRVGNSIEIGDVDKGRLDACLDRQKVLQEGVGAAINRVGGDYFVAGIAHTQHRAGDRCHPTGGAVTGLSALQGRHLSAQVIDGWVEVPPVKVTPLVRPPASRKQLGHRLRIYHRKRRTGLDGHVDAAVLTEFVAQVRQVLDRISLVH